MRINSLIHCSRLYCTSSLASIVEFACTPSFFPNQRYHFGLSRFILSLRNSYNVITFSLFYFKIKRSYISIGQKCIVSFEGGQCWAIWNFRNRNKFLALEKLIVWTNWIRRIMIIALLGLHIFYFRESLGRPRVLVHMNLSVHESLKYKNLSWRFQMMGTAISK